MSQDEYDVNQYTEEELINILDMNNPTDNELEAQILRNINMYENNDDPQSKKLSKFYNDIYDRFFSETVESSPLENPQLEELILPPSNSQFEKSYSTTIVIDSQYRNPNTYITSTEFSLDLSTTVKNVTQMVLESVTIPITWYNINDGENTFYIIQTDNNSNRYTVSIPPGNYGIQTLIVEINNALKQLPYTDVSFGNTEFIYQSSLNSVYLNVDITSLYNESTYNLKYEPKITLVESDGAQIP